MKISGKRIFSIVMTKDGKYQKHMEESKYSFTCRCCGISAHRNLSSTMKRLGQGNVYCSMACRKKQGEINRLNGQWNRLVAADARKREREADALKLVIYPCGHCGVTLELPKGKMGRRLNCADCRSDLKAMHKQKASAARKARERGAAVVDTRILPSEIFERSGWRCTYCRVDTPKRLRGTHAHNAPELDHMMPLSKGGAHIKENLTCACRKCNAEKSDRSFFEFIFDRSMIRAGIESTGRAVLNFSEA